MEKLNGCGEFSIQLEDISIPQEDLSSHQEELSIQQEELTSLQEEIQPQRRESSTKDNINVQINVKESKQSSMKEWTQPASTKATADGRKRKAEVLDENSKKNLLFNKRGKRKYDEIIELARTNKNIFSWLKPTPPPPNIKVAEVV